MSATHLFGPVGRLYLFGSSTIPALVVPNNVSGVTIFRKWQSRAKNIDCEHARATACSSMADRVHSTSRNHGLTTRVLESRVIWVSSPSFYVPYTLRNICTIWVDARREGCGLRYKTFTSRNQQPMFTLLGVPLIPPRVYYIVHTVLW